MKLYNDDCLEVMDKLIEDGVKVDAIITDPPYGTTACKWDSIIPFEPMWERLNKLIKDNGAIVLFSKQPFSSYVVVSNAKDFQYEIIWEKTRAGNNMQVKNKPSAIHENILIFYKKQPTYNEIKWKVDEKYRDKRKSINNSYYNTEHYQGVMRRKADDGTRHPQSVLYFNSVWARGMHPTQKPVPLMEYLIKTYTNEGETVLDFTMGSGTTGVACKNLNRDFIGIETDKNYFEVAKERIKDGE